MTSKEKTSNFFVVGIGSSAGGLEALRSLLTHLPKANLPFSIIIAQHVSPSHQSKMDELLDKICSWPVVHAHNEMPFQEGKVYITPPNNEISLRDGLFVLTRHSEPSHPAPSIDNFFESLAEECRDRAIAVILSGSGHDGSSGISHIKEHNGFVIAQSSEEANHDSMPESARKTGHVDLVCETHMMPQKILDYIQNFNIAKTNPSHRKDSLAVILELMEKRYRTDFSKYKSSTITRRVEKRINDLQLSGIHEYYLKIKETPNELDNLFNTVLIGVTDFFRDPSAFEFLRTKIERRLQESEHKHLRFWSVGCASGKEPYTIALIIADILQDRLKEYTIQIFATDIDESALAVARKGYYSKESLEGLSQDYIDNYFTQINGGYEIQKQIRQMVLFSKHDITNDPPFVKLDFISCRNLLIYFKLELQKEIIPIFHYALKPGGYLLLGKSENVAQVSNLFYKSENREKLFQRKDDVELNTLNFRTFNKGTGRNSDHDATIARPEMSLEEIAEETLIKTFEHPYVVLDEHMETSYIKGSLHPFLDLSEGALNSNILKLIHHSLHTELRTLFAKTKRNNQAAKSNIIRFEAYELDIYVQLSLKPLLYKKNQKQHYLLVFEKINAEERYPFNKEILSNKDFRDSVRIIELEQELNASREHLQTFTEELETSNEELQAMNEELQSSNEELKSTNEELETSNEELQSTNEELQTANSELNISNENLIKKENELVDRERELRQTTNRFEMLLNNSRIFMACQDKDLRYEWVYNQSSKYTLDEIYGKTDDELFGENDLAGQFISIKKRVLKTKKEAQEEISFNDQYWNLKVRPWYDGNEMIGILVLAIDITKERKTLHALELQNRSIQSLIEGTDDYVLIVDNNMSVQVLSKRLNEDLRNVDITLEKGDKLKSALKKRKHLKNKILSPLEKALTGQLIQVEDFENISTDGESNRHYSVRAFPVKGEKGSILGAALIGTEVTNLLRTKNKIQDVLKRGAQLTEVDYFRDLTLQMYELFSCKYTYVGVIDHTSNAIDTMAIRINGKLASNFSYQLKNVPCEVVNRTEEIQRFKGVSSIFPDDIKLREWDAKTYIGVPVSSPIDGRMLGIMVMISEEEVDISSNDEYLLTILSLRAGAELLRERSNQELQRRDEQLRKITANSPDFIYELEHAKDGSKSFTYASEAINEIFEITPTDAMENVKTVYNTLHPDDLESFRSLWKKHEGNPKSITWQGRIITKKTNTTKWIKISTRPDPQEDGSVLWNGIIDDITLQKEIENQLENAKDIAEEAASAKENFLATMSHEIRTPLNAICGIAELLQLEHSNIQYLDILKYSSENLLSLINNILDFSKIKAGKFKINNRPFNLRLLLDNLIRAVRFQADLRNNKVVLKKSENLPETLVGDELILLQILNNLLSNANKFTEYGNITLIVELLSIDKDVAKILFVVQDTGAGISKNDLQAIFEKFEQANHKNVAGGSGLGLTISKALLNMQDSDISVESAVNEGSRFYFEMKFDLYKEDSEKEASREKEKIKKKKTASKILLVEDTDDNKKLILAYFSKFSHIEFVTASNGKEALEEVKDKSFDLVFMDVRMPEMGGNEASKIIRSWEDSYYKKLPIIALTADTFNIDDEKVFTDVVTKPFKFRQLQQAIEKYTKKADLVE